MVKPFHTQPGTRRISISSKWDKGLRENGFLNRTCSKKSRDTVPSKITFLVVFFQSISSLSLFLYDAAPVQAGSEAFFKS
jgi:hypothetical protein